MGPRKKIASLVFRFCSFLESMEVELNVAESFICLGNFWNFTFLRQFLFCLFDSLSHILFIAVEVGATVGLAVGVTVRLTWE